MYILVDTTIWINFFREKEKSKPADALQKLVEEENDICISECVNENETPK